jgi:stage II sporulation protein AA (anti-sigma F factor antagonist)
MTIDSAGATDGSPDPGALSIRSARDGDTHVIELAGELDLATAAEVERELRRVQLSDARVIAVDLRKLTFIESTGVRLIVEAQRMSRASNRLVFVRGTRAVQRPFEICDVLHRLPFVDQLPSEDAAGVLHARGTAISRRVSQAALAAAVRELRTRRRPGVLG